ncbi:6091_t:CDS:2, partial [Rhizophagus irregularis]
MVCETQLSENLKTWLMVEYSTIPQCWAIGQLDVLDICPKP